MTKGYRPMGLKQDTVFDSLCPFHVRYNQDGIIQSVGPTMAKLRPYDLIGHKLTDVFEILSPKEIVIPEQVIGLEGRRLHMRFSEAPRTPFKGDISAGFDAFVLNLSFNHGTFDAIKKYNLTATDFANTDLAFEFLYLLEAKSALQADVEALIEELHQAKSTAEKQATTDQLTGLKNRRALSTSMDNWVSCGRAFACMHLDLDYFKAVNDTYGHAAGDVILQNVAQVLNSETRSTDIVARIGGDEFVLLFHDITDHETLDAVANRIITKLEVPVKYEGHLCRISGSAGTTISTGYADPNPDNLLNDADMALYASKAAGRGCHTFFSDTLALKAN